MSSQSQSRKAVIKASAISVMTSSLVLLVLPVAYGYLPAVWVIVLQPLLINLF